MEQLTDVKQVVGDAAHQLPYLLIIIKAEGQLLVMGKNFVAHIVFHFCAHDMSVISNKIIAIAFQYDQSSHNNGQSQNHMQRFGKLSVNHIIGYIADDQGNYQSNACAHAGKEHIRRKHFFIGFIVG